MSGKGYIAEEPEEICEFCGKCAELRPYGPNNERICFECEMKDPQTVERKFRQYVFGE